MAVQDGNLSAALCAGALVLLTAGLMRIPCLCSSPDDGLNGVRNMLRVY